MQNPDKKDIGDIHKQEAETDIASEGLYRSIFENAPLAIFQSSLAGRVITVNPAFACMFGYESPEEFLRTVKDAASIFANPKRRQEIIHLRAENPTLKTFENLYRRKDGSIFLGRLTVEAILDTQGNVAFFEGFIEDITERKQAQNALQESVERLQILSANIPDAIIYQILLTPDGSRRFTYISPKVEQIHGVTPEEVMRSPQVLYNQIIEEDRQKLVAAEEQAMSNIAAFKIEVRFLDQHGKKRWILLTSTPRQRSNEGILWDGIELDITERKRAEEALKESEERYRIMFMESPDAYLLLEQGIVIDCNHSAEKMLRGSREQIIGLTPTLFSPEFQPDGQNSHQAAQDRINETLQRGKNTFEWIHCRLDGSEFPVAVSITTIRLKGKRVLFGCLRDITQRKQAEEERDRILTLSEDLICIAGMDGFFKYVNPAWERLLGYSTQELLTRPFLDFIHPDDHKKNDAEVASLAQGHKTLDFENRYVCKDGTIRYILWRATAMLKEKLMYCVGRDITERKRTEAAQIESERRFRELFEGSRDGFVIVNSFGKFLDANPAYCDMLGYTLEELRSLENFYQLTPEKWREWESTEIWNRRLLKDGYTGIYEKEYIRKDGSIFPVEIHAYTIFNQDGTPSYLWGVARDITERKRAEEEQAKLQAQLTQAQKMEAIGRLAGGVAHDFNNMLGVILGYTDIGLESVPSQTALYENFAQIKKAAQRSAELTRQLLAFARKQTVTPKVIDLNITVESTLKMLSRLIGENIELLWQPAARLKPVLIDPVQIDQILANLCVNARDAIGHNAGKITIKTSMIDIDETYCSINAWVKLGQYIILEVTDNGCGMDNATLSNLFEPFFTTKGMGKGTGLGLATVYGIVKQNNGFINVDSKLGKGTTFCIYLPCHTASTAEASGRHKAESPLSGNETILLVEDEPIILDMTRKMLKRLGYTVLAAATPNESINLAREHAGKLHLLITDVIMPEMTGLDLAKKLLTLYPDLKRLFMSGYPADIIGHEGVLDEGINFIQKPFLLKELASKIREVLSA